MMLYFDNVGVVHVMKTYIDGTAFEIPRLGRQNFYQQDQRGMEEHHRWICLAVEERAAKWWAKGTTTSLMAVGVARRLAILLK